MFGLVAYVLDRKMNSHSYRRFAASVAACCVFSFVSLPLFASDSGDVDEEPDTPASGMNSPSSGGNAFQQDTGLGARRSGSSAFKSRDKRQPQDQRTDIEQQRDRDRRDKSRARNSGQSGTANKQTAAGGQSKQPGGQSIVKGKAPAAGKKGAAGSAGSARAATTVQFRMKADPSANILLLESADQSPTMNISAVQGGKFVTRAVFRNGHRSAFRVVDIALKYDPQILRPEGIDDSALESLLTAPSQANVDARRGRITYHAEFSEPRRDDLFTLFRVEWKALAPAQHTAIAFVNQPNFPTRVLEGGKNVLQPKEEDTEIEVSENSGLLDADVTVIPDNQTAQEIEEAGPEFTGIQIANNISQGTAEGGITLALRPRQRSVRTGEDFFVDIVYANPKKAEMDSVRLKVVFDPKVLQVVDYDDENWISRGTNIYDGEYHEDLPFDFHVRNAAYNLTGEIYYEMGFANRVRVPSSGVIATIRFRATAPSPSASIAFDLSEGENSRTSISFFGFNLIGTPGDRAAALANAAVSID